MHVPSPPHPYPDVPRAARTPLAVASCLYVLAAFALGQATWIRGGNYDPRAVAWLAIAAIAVAAGVFGRYPSRANVAAGRLLPALIAVAALIQFCQPALPLAALRLQGFPVPVSGFFTAVLVGAAAAVPALVGRPRAFARLAVPVVITAYIFMGLWFIRAVPVPHIDVFTFQVEGARAILAGHNPYAITIPDIYGPRSPWYQPGMVVNGRVQSGYSYLPLSLLQVLPGYVLGDVRYAHLAASAAAAAVMAYGAGGRRGRTAAARAAVLFLSFPRGMWVIENAFIEPQMLIWAAVTVWWARRNADDGTDDRPLWVPLGLLVAVKQYALLALPAASLLLPRPLEWRRSWRAVWLTAAVVAVATVPLAMWNPRAFAHSMTALHYGVLRTDAISFAAFLARATGVRLPLSAAFAAALVVSFAVVRWGPRSPSGFAAGAALIHLVMFGLGELAFGNYYYYIAGLLCLAIAAEPPAPPVRRPSPGAAAVAA